MFQHIVKSAAAAALLGGVLSAAEVDVEIVNLTGGNYFSPPD